MALATYEMIAKISVCRATGQEKEFQNDDDWHAWQGERILPWREYMKSRRCVKMKTHGIRWRAFYGCEGKVGTK